MITREMPIKFNRCKYCFQGIDHPTKSTCSSEFGVHPDYPRALDYIRMRSKAPNRHKNISHDCDTNKYNITRRQYRRIINKAHYNSFFDGPREDYDLLVAHISKKEVQ